MTKSFQKNKVYLGVKFAEDILNHALYDTSLNSASLFILDMQTFKIGRIMIVSTVDRYGPIRHELLVQYTETLEATLRIELSDCAINNPKSILLDKLVLAINSQSGNFLVFPTELLDSVQHWITDQSSLTTFPLSLSPKGVSGNIDFKDLLSPEVIRVREAYLNIDEVKFSTFTENMNLFDGNSSASVVTSKPRETFLSIPSIRIIDCSFVSVPENKREIEFVKLIEGHEAPRTYCLYHGDDVKIIVSVEIKNTDKGIITLRFLHRDLEFDYAYSDKGDFISDTGEILIDGKQYQLAVIS